MMAFSSGGIVALRHRFDSSLLTSGPAIPKATRAKMPAAQTKMKRRPRPAAMAAPVIGPTALATEVALVSTP